MALILSVLLELEVCQSRYQFKPLEKIKKRLQELPKSIPYQVTLQLIALGRNEVFSNESVLNF